MCISQNISIVASLIIKRAKKNYFDCERFSYYDINTFFSSSLLSYFCRTQNYEFLYKFYQERERKGFLFFVAEREKERNYAQ